jgi:hypothetical protein
MLRGFHPRRSAPPNAITNEKVITALSQSAGAVRGTGTVPSYKASMISHENQFIQV